MVQSGPSTPVGGAQSVSPALMRSNSAILGSHGAQGTFNPLVSSRAQYNMNVLGSTPNISSLLNQSYVNGGSISGLSVSGGIQRGGINNGSESDPMSGVANDMGYSPSPSSFTPSNMSTAATPNQVQNQQFSNPSQALADQHQPQIQHHLAQKFQHSQQPLQQFATSHGQQQQPPQLQSARSGLSGLGPVKLEPQMVHDQSVVPQQQVQSLRSLGSVKMDPQQNLIPRGLGPVKMEPQQADQPLLLQQQHQQQQQQQQFLQMSRQSPQAAVAQMNLLQQQRILQFQQQQQLLKVLPQQRLQLQQQLQQQNVPMRSVARLPYEPGTCARRLTQYMYQQQQRPQDNNIEFWRKFVAEYFAPNAKKRWCVSLYGSSRQTNGVFPQDVWHCEICNRKPGRGFETTAEVLPRLCKIKYDSGTLEELLYVDMPHEYQNASGQIVLDYAKAIQESIFDQLRVVREGQLRIVFSSDLKICSWEFCARRHEELIPRRLIIPQVNQLAAAAQKYQASAQNTLSNVPEQELQTNCNLYFVTQPLPVPVMTYHMRMMFGNGQIVCSFSLAVVGGGRRFVSSARQLTKALEVPLVNDLGYTKRYVRCLQISEVVNSMKDLIDYSRETGKGPIDSLATFSRKASPLGQPHYSGQQPEEQAQQPLAGQNSNNDHASVQAISVPFSAANGITSGNNSVGTTSNPTSGTTVVGLLHQNSINSRHENLIANPNSPYAGTPGQIPSAGSSTTLPSAQPNPSSPFSSPTPSSSNNAPQPSHNAITTTRTGTQINSANSPALLQQSPQSNDGDPNESQSSVDKIIQEIMNSQFGDASDIVGVGSGGSSVKNVNNVAQISNNSFGNGNPLAGNAMLNNSLGINGTGSGSFGGGMGISATAGGARAIMGNNSMTMHGRVGMPLIPLDAGINHQRHEFGGPLLNSYGTVNGFNNLQFDWKPSQ
ncbi:LIM-domain binding protein/SEUSS [Dillenia turbinata]|uniref:LIM-domain binding protein/SEUSS n=1 Tax=Dillenia turbinata TaxID=194707 RepID=A0AAN8UYC9_9MAGN